MRKILAIDDQPDNLTTIKAVIINNIPNCEVITALSGKEGIRIAKKEQPDTILLDIIMPQMDGFETCQKLKEDETTKHIPIILVTAIKTDSKSRVRGLDTGADAFVAKPIDAIELSAQVKVMLRIKEAEDKLREEKEALRGDVTKKTSELKVSEEKYQNMFENMLNGFAYHKIVTDKNGKPIDYIFLEVNDSFEKLTGLKRKKIIGERVTNIIPGIEKDSLDWIGIYGEVALTRDEIRFENFSESTNSWYSIYAYSPQKGYFATIFEDITDNKQAEKDLKESENKYRNLVETAQDGICILQDSKVKFFNTGLEKMWGGTREEIINTPFSNYIHPDEVQKLTEYYKKRLSNQGVPSIYQTKLLHKDGHEVYAEISASLITYEGKPAALIVIRDVTEFREANEAIKENEQRLKILFESAPDAYYLHDFKGVFLDGNKQAEKLMGYKKEYLIGKSFLNLKLLSGKEMLRATKVLMKNVQGKSTGPDEFILNRKDGNEVQVEISTHPVKIKNKRVILGIARNISKRKKTEETLIKLSTAVEQSPSVIAITDPKGVLEYVNPKFTKLTGYTSKDVLGERSSILKSGEQPETYYKDLWTKISSGKEWRGEFHNKTKNGKLVWESASISPVFDEKGRITNYIKVSEDITERKRADLIQNVIFNISNAVNTSDDLGSLINNIKLELGTIINTNNFFVALYDRKSDTLSFPYYADEKDSFKTASAANTLTKYVIETNKPLLANLALKRKFVKEGKLKHIGSLSKVWLGVPLRIGKAITGVFAVQSYTDDNAFNESDMSMLEFVSNQISLSINRKKAEDDLKAALTQAMESDRLKSAFLANMSHEIRTPMNGILGFASLLHNKNLTSEQLTKYTNIIEKSGDRLLNIINDLLDISKIEAGQMDLSLSECNVNEQIEFLHTFFQPEANNKGIEIQFSTGLPSRESSVITDREKLYAILTNLIKNAIKYTHSGNINFGYEKKGKKLEFHVVDSGIGINKERQKAIFERFVQADIEDSKALEGAGLGLAITKAYVEMLGGTIWVHSIEGKGSDFCFTIPYNSVKEKTATPKEAIPELGLLSKRIKVLIAEDDELADDFLTIITQEFSSETLHTKNGNEAVELCRQNPDIDLILMDIKMPVMDGFEATRKIREFNKDIIIIAQTAFALAGDKEKAIAAGCDDYITKPIDKDKLMKMISKHIKKE